MVKSNFEINNKICNIEVKGSTNEIILELSLILMRIKSSDNKTYRDILKSMEIINNSIDDGIDVDELQNMFIGSYLKKTLKKVTNND